VNEIYWVGIAVAMMIIGYVGGLVVGFDRWGKKR